MPRKPGNLNPDSASGNAGLRVGRSGPNSGRYRQDIISNVKLQATYKAMNNAKSHKFNTNSIIGTYKPTTVKSGGMSNFEMYGIGVGTGAALGVAGATIANDRYKSEQKRKKAIKKASVKTRKGQSAGR